MDSTAVRKDSAACPGRAVADAPLVPGYRVISSPGAVVHVEVRTLSADERARVSTAGARIPLPRPPAK